MKFFSIEYICRRKYFSFHCKLVSSTAEDFVGDNNFLGTSPEVFMPPSVSPFHEIKHGEHRNTESFDEWLLSNNWEKCINECRGDQAIFEASVLIVRDPCFTVFKVILRNGCDIRVVDQVCHQLPSLVPSWGIFSH